MREVRTVTDVEIADLLDKGAVEIERRGLFKGWYFAVPLDEKGSLLSTDVDPSVAQSCALCALGAIGAAANDGGAGDPNDLIEGFKVIRCRIEEVAGSDAATVNDDEDSTQESVVAWMRGAAVKLRDQVA